MEELSRAFPGEFTPCALPVAGVLMEGRAFIPGDIFQAQKISFGPGTMLLAQNILEGFIGLNQAIERTPDINFFINACKYKEAVLTSRIRGATARLEDSYSSRVTTVGPEKRDDIAEINAYHRALERAVELMQQHPLDAKLLRQTHAVLLKNTRGKDSNPGKFRKTGVYISATGYDIHFIPPPDSYVPIAMDNLVEFIQDKTPFIPSPIKAALIHYQFESIHPFQDGNGRLGRMLFSLYLHKAKYLPHPAVLYMSGFFSRHPTMYYEKLNRASKSIADLVGWVDFCMQGMLDNVVHGMATANQIAKLYASMTTLIQNKQGQPKEKHMKLLHELFLHPVVTIKSVQEVLGVGRQAAARHIKRFVAWGILVDRSGPKKERLYVCAQYLSMLEENSPATDQL